MATTCAAFNDSPHSSTLSVHKTPPSSHSPSPSTTSAESCSASVSSLELDEGEGEWDLMGRMSSIRRSSRFDKPQLTHVTLSRGPEGYGLELQGLRPPIIGHVFGAASERGLRAGDRLLEINGESARDLTHHEAGQLITACPHTVTILVHTRKPTIVPKGNVVYSGWLSKKGGSGFTPRNWRRRWFVVRDDCIAYYYENPEEGKALGAIVLRNYTVAKATRDVRRSFAFKLVKGGSRSYYLAADTEQEMNKWAQVFTEAATLEGRESVHFSGTAHNVSLSALSIRDPDCHGFLYKQGHSIRTWKKRYCVLKNHQLFYYGKMHHTTAYGVMHLQNYSLHCGRSQEKRFYFEAHPPDRCMRVYCFYCDTAIDRERWMTAIGKCTETDSK